MSDHAEPLRVVQWTTGNVSRQAVRAVLAHPELALVGAFARSADKRGRDVADLCGLPNPTGIVATGDVDDVTSLRPDCVIYTPLHFDVAEVSSLLRAGINVVTSAEFLTGRCLPGDQRSVLEAAAAAGGASIFGSGMNPGFVELLAGAAAGASLGVRHVRVTESVDVSLYAGDANFDAFGWGRPANDPGHGAAVEAATAVFAEGLEVLTRILGVEPDDIRCTVDFAHAASDLDLPGRPIAHGTVAGIDVRWEALVAGQPVVELHQRWVMSSALEPPLQVEHGWIIEVAGDPRLKLRLDVWPDTDDLASLTAADFHDIGMRLTAVPLVNAIPAVCAAPAGIRTYADLPMVSSRLAAHPRGRIVG